MDEKKVQRTLKLQPKISREIDRLAREAGLSFSDVANMLLREALTGQDWRGAVRR